jgi:hypothetical protein
VRRHIGQRGRPPPVPDRDRLGISNVPSFCFQLCFQPLKNLIFELSATGRWQWDINRSAVRKIDFADIVSHKQLLPLTN